MLTALTSLALIGLALHTKYIHASAMEEMLRESGEQPVRHLKQEERPCIAARP